MDGSLLEAVAWGAVAARTAVAEAGAAASAVRRTCSSHQRVLMESAIAASDAMLTAVAASDPSAKRTWGRANV